MKNFTLFKLAISVFVSIFLMAHSTNIFAQCTNTSSYGSATAPTSGSVTFSTCSYQTEYSTLSSVVAATTYSCAINSGGYVTIRSGSYNGTVVAHGNSPLTWTATTSGTHYCHWNTNSSCGTATSCVTTTCTFISSGSSGPACGDTPLGSISPSSCSPQNANYSSGTIPYWSFSATSGYTYHFSLTSNTEDSYLRLYNSSYTQIAYNDDNGPFGSGVPASLSWTCTSTGTYYISAAGYSCVSFTNSSYLNYWSTPAVYGSGSGNTITPTTSWQNQAYTSGSLYWYKFSATSGATYDFSLCTNTEDSYIRIFDLNWNIITSFDDNGPYCTGTPSSGSWVATSSATFIVSIYHYGCSAFSNSGNLEYKYVLPCTPPPNNNCSDVTPITLVDGVTQTFTGTGYCSTPQLGTYKDVWIAFNVPCSGMDVTLDFCTSSPVHTNAYTNVFTDCTLATFYTAGSWDFTTCTDGNITLFWTGLPAGNYWYAVLIDPTWETDYTAHVLGTCPCITPADPTVSGSATICNGQSPNISATSTNATTIYWYTGSCGGTQVGTSSPGSNFSVSPTTTTTYYARGYNSAGSGCWSSGCGSVTITVNQLSTDPTSASASLTTICNGESSTLTLNGGGGGTGEVINWYAGSCGGTSVGTSNGLSVSPTTTTTYYGRYEDGAPCSYNSACSSVTITVNQLPAITGQPSNSSITYGDATNFSVTATDGTSYQWQEYISSWNDITNGGVYSNAATATLNLTKPPVSMNGYKYRCVVSGICSPPATSDGNATLTVTPESLSVTANSGQFKYETQADPVFSYTAIGFITGEDESVLTGALSRVTDETVGLYAITQGTLDGANYAIGFTSADFEIKPAYELEISTFLQGSWAGGGLMSTTLNAAGQLPTSQPFNTAPWGYTGTETLPSPLSPDVVDWVLVELRSDESTTLEKKAGLMYKDGSIKVSFSGSTPAGDYAVVWHRNHMPVMSGSKVSLPIEGATYDLSTASNLYGTNPAIDLGGGIYGMIAGDVTKNGVLQYSGPGNDRGAIISQIASIVGAGTTTNSVVTGGYWFEDVNLNNELRYLGTDDDRSIIFANLNTLTGNAQTNSIYTSVVPGGSKGIDTGTNEGPFDILITESGQALSIVIATSEAVVNGLIDNIQFTLSWKAADEEIAEILASFTSDFLLVPQGEAIDIDGVMFQVYATTTPVNLPEIFNEGDQQTVMSIINTLGQPLTGRLWIADNDFTTNNNAMYYVSVWGTDFTGMIQSLATGIDEIPAMESVTIYPNPATTDKVNIALNLTKEQKVSITLMSMQGKEISTTGLNVKAGLSINPLDINGLNPGAYFIRISGHTINTIKKLIIK